MPQSSALPLLATHQRFARRLALLLCLGVGLGVGVHTGMLFIGWDILIYKMEKCVSCFLDQTDEKASANATE